MSLRVWILAGAIAAVPSVHSNETIRLYAAPPTGAERYVGPERRYHSDQWQTDVVVNVSNPTLTAFLPDQAKANGTAVIIAPGGGFHALSINSEGNDVAQWLTEHGVAAFVLRYRLVPSQDDAVAEMATKTPAQAQRDMAAIAPLAGADGLAAMALVRGRAKEFAIDADRIGFMGFSAGGAVAAHVAFNYDTISRPDFVAPVYAAVAWLGDAPLRKDAPPAFIVAASDDQLGLAKDSIALYGKWLQAGQSAELHMYARGGHGFGMRKQGLPADTWIERFGEWLGQRGLLQVAD